MFFSYAKLHGDASAVRKFSGKFPNLCESTVRGFRNSYATALASKKRSKGKDFDISKDNIKALERSSSVGRPLKLGKLDQDVQRRLKLIRESGGRVDTQMALTVAKAVIRVKGAPSSVGDLDRG